MAPDTSLTHMRHLWQGLEDAKPKGGPETAAETRSSWTPGSTQQASTSPGNAPELSQQPLHPVLEDVALVLERLTGVAPGRGCVIGEGLATVELGLMVQGYHVSLELAGHGAAGGGSTRELAEARVRSHVLASQGWAAAIIDEVEWAAADEHKRVHLVVDAVNKAVGQDKEAGGGGGHEHSGGCCGGRSH
ncbi:hypothetical protein FOA52_011766 [Chlamydomonas sp. UWO 241]|nr:hypothetical protein FOA52_011766 [Chlamydomonas sp. UWO 241]